MTYNVCIQGIEISGKSIKTSFHSDIYLDIAILNHTVLSAPEALVVYLVEEKKLSFSDIAQSLNRDRRTIWTLYNRALKKIETKFYRSTESGISIPLSALSDRDLSFTESVVVYLRQQGHKNKEIAAALGKDPRSVGLLLSRAKKKRGDIK